MRPPTAGTATGLDSDSPEGTPMEASPQLHAAAGERARDILKESIPKMPGAAAASDHRRALKRYSTHVMMDGLGHGMVSGQILCVLSRCMHMPIGIIMGPITTYV